MTQHATGGAPEVRVIAVPYARVSPLAWVALIVLIGGVLWISVSFAPSSALPRVSSERSTQWDSVGQLATALAPLAWSPTPTATATATSTPVPTATAIPTPVPLSARYPACDERTAPSAVCYQHAVIVSTPTVLPDCRPDRSGVCRWPGDWAAHARQEVE